jgi:hypothetical protein
MALPAEVSDLVTTEFRAALSGLGLAQHRVAQLFGVGPRSVRRWQSGDRRVPCGVRIVLRLLIAGTVTVDQVERAAAPDRATPTSEPISIPDRPHVDSQSDDIHDPDDISSSSTVMTVNEDRIDDPSPIIAEPTLIPETRATPISESISIPDRSQLDDISACVGSDDADPTLTTAEKVVALTSHACRWPCGDPEHPDFHFCSDLVIAQPYCEHHRAMAYATPRTGGGHGASVGRVTHEGRPRPQQTQRSGAQQRRLFALRRLLWRHRMPSSVKPLSGNPNNQSYPSDDVSEPPSC